MNKRFTKMAAVGVLGGTIASLAGCTSAKRAGIGAWGQPALVEKFSGGKLVFAGISEGKVYNEAGSDGYHFSDSCKRGSQSNVSGDVVITHPEPMPSCAAILAKVEGPSF